MALRGYIAFPCTAGSRVSPTKRSIATIPPKQTDHNSLAPSLFKEETSAM